MNRIRIVLACTTLLIPHNGFASPRDEGPPRVTSRHTCEPGFLAVADTNTCLKVSGRVRAEFVTGRASSPGSGLRSQGRIGLDARTRTAYGTLRTVIRAQGGRDGF